MFAKKFALHIFLAFLILSFNIVCAHASWLGTLLGIRHFNLPFKLMEPTIRKGENVKADMNAYDNAEISRGDIVVYRFPEDRKKLFIGRIIGMPSETIKIVNGDVYINHNKISDPWGWIGEKINDQAILKRMRYFGPYKIEKDHYFLMGDNRDQSYDSRFWFGEIGTGVPRSDIIGKVIEITKSDIPTRVGLTFPLKKAPKQNQ